jgi:gluconokinase
MVRAMDSGRSATAQVVVVMGVSGVGKTTVAHGLAAALGWAFAEGDDLHPAANVAKMAAGQPLVDEDRWPWLAAVREWVDGRLDVGMSAVVTCSALKRSYRHVLRAGRPELRFCEIDAPTDVLVDRLSRRAGHYMPPSLLPSQLATLEPLADDEPGVRVPATGTPDDVVRAALTALGLVAAP